MALTRDEVTVYIFATRYAMMRQTSALNLVVVCMAKHIEDFSDHDLKYLIEESQRVVEFKKRFLHTPDVDTHMRLQAMCKKELDRRGKSDLYRR